MLGFCEMLEDFGGVAFGFDGGPDAFNFAGFADEERAADNAHEFASHELLLLPGAVSFDGVVIGIAEQGKIEFELGLEQGLPSDRIGAQAEDGHFELIEFLLCVAKLGRLDNSTGGIGFGEEEKENAAALEIFQRDGFVLVGFEAERRGFVAGLEHGNSLADIVAGLVAGFEFRDVVWSFGDDVARGLLDGRFADLSAESFGGDDVRGSAAGFEHGGEDPFADGGGNFSGLDHC